MGLGHKIGSGHMDPQAPLFIDGVFLPGKNHLIDQVRNAQYVLVGLRGKAQHKIELDAIPAPGESLGAGGEDFLLRQILVNHIPQPLGARLRGKGQSGFADGLELFHQLPREVVRPERGHGKADMVGFAVGKHIVRQRF